MSKFIIRLALALSMAVPALADGAAPQFPKAPPLPPAEYPPGDLGELVKLGRELVHSTDTHPLSRAYVGNKLRCTSCHLEDGTNPKAATFIGLATAYPAYSPREKTVITLEDRVANCFMRSMNGTRPPIGSKPSLAITAYITWLSQGLPMAMNSARPAGPYSFMKLPLPKAKADAARGKSLFAEKCAACHGVDGAGVEAAFPPVWGEKSFNMGAGLANVAKLTSWLKVAMPYGNPNLTDSEAADIAAFVDSQPRSGFDLKVHLPKEGQAGVVNTNVWDDVRPGIPAKN
jgi:thiosulfate dehydrogenase